MEEHGAQSHVVQGTIRGRSDRGSDKGNGIRHAWLQNVGGGGNVNARVSQRRKVEEACRGGGASHQPGGQLRYGQGSCGVKNHAYGPDRFGIRGKRDPAR